jgi:hypothetical protein
MNDVTLDSAELLHRWLNRQLADSAARWLQDRLAELRERPSDRTLFLAIGLAPRKVGKDDLLIREKDLAAAERCRAGWRPVAWSVDQAARLLLLLRAGGDEEQFARRLEQLFATADVGELVTFYRGLPLYPGQPRYLRRATEGVRTNMKAVFKAVAHDNPYPAEQFDDGAWNQMILKALFIGSRLHPIIGLERRANPELMRMLCDYAHERWAAGRDVSPELWRCVGPHADSAALADLERVLHAGNERERQAAVLALSASRDAGAAALLATVPELAIQVKRTELTWGNITEQSLT